MLAMLTPSTSRTNRASQPNPYHPKILPPEKPRKQRSKNMASTTSAPLIPDKVMPEVYISDISTARAVLSPNYQTPDRPRIRYILSLLNEKSQQPKVPAGQEGNFVLHFILLRDNDHEDLLAILEEAINFIISSLKNNDGGVLVHCHQGISRSASVMVAFAMEEMNLDFPTALAYVRRSRPKANPNKGFTQQLGKWYQMGCSIRNASGQLKEEYLRFKTENQKLGSPRRC